MKLYITGPVGSGKSTLARRVAAQTRIPCYHLDEVVYTADPTDSWGNRKRSTEERDALFAVILLEACYIMEDAGRECFVEGMRQADRVVLLEPSGFVRRRRIVLRWLKQNLGLEASLYRPRWAVLRAMFRWSHNWDTEADGVRARLMAFAGKTVVLHNDREANAWLASLCDTNQAKGLNRTQ